MARPYRYIDSAKLEEQKEACFRNISSLVQAHLYSTQGPLRRELRRINRELDRRGRWVRESDQG